MNRVTELWVKNIEEIMESVTNVNHKKKQKKENVDEIIKREQKGIRILLITGIIYLLLGFGLLWGIMQENLFSVEPQNYIICIELIILGIYVFLHALLFYCMNGCWKEKKLVRIIKNILLFLMLPYHLCIKLIKAFIKDRRQEHVIHLLPYYLLSILIVMFSFIIIVHIISALEIREIYNEMVGFIIVGLLIVEFFGVGELFAYLYTKSVIKMEQRIKVKSSSMKNWRDTLNNDVHKEERQRRFDIEWKNVKTELEYTRIYFYIVLTVLVLWIPKKDGTLTSLLLNQFLGVATVAALAREVRSKKEDDEES